MFKCWNFKLANLLLISICSIFTLACSEKKSVEVAAPEVRVQNVKLENVPVNFEW